MTQRKRDLIIGILFLMFSVGLFLEAGQYTSVIQGDMGSRFMPRLIAILMAILSVAKIVGAAKEPEKVQEERQETERSDKLGGGLTVALIVGYTLAFKPLGFILSTFLYLFAQMMLLSQKENRKIPLFFAISIIAPILIYLFFVHVMGRPMPQGLITFI